MGRVLFALAVALGVPAAAVAAASTPAVAAASDQPVGTGPVTAANAGSASHGPPLTLLGQAPWVAPGEPMALRLSTGEGSRAGLTLSVSLYSHLTTRSAFTETESGTALGTLLSTVTVPFSSLPADPSGGFDLAMPVDSGDAPVPADTALALRLGCAPGTCLGVYPLRVELSSSQGHTELTTYLVYVHPPAGTERLRFALVLPLAVGALPTGTDGTVPAPRSADLARLGDLASALGRHAGVAVTLEPEPAALAALGTSTRPAARAALSAVDALGASPERQVLSQSVVPVDPAALTSAGLSSELEDQVHRASQLLAPLHGAGGTWVAGGPLDQSALAALGNLGFAHVVLPPGAVSQATTRAGLTPSQPFVLDAGRGTAPQAIESDPGLEAHLAQATGASATLAAYQLLADLALVYYEQPNLTTPRGVVAVAPAPFDASPTFLDTVLGALQDDPVVQPDTLDALFSELPLLSDASHRPVSSSTSSTLPARQIRGARARLAAFAASVDQAGTPTVRALGDQLLSSEDERLRPSEQQQGVAGFGRALDAQLAQLSIRTDTIRLTSTAAKVPVTVVKQLPYGISGVLEITGEKVVFAPGSSQQPGSVCRDPVVRASAGRSSFSCLATFGHTTNAVYVEMRARATGDFRLSITLTSPSGHLLLASNQLTVRSLSASVVAVVLSLAALAVLLAWWARTWRRRPRRGAHLRRQPTGPPATTP